MLQNFGSSVPGISYCPKKNGGTATSSEKKTIEMLKRINCLLI